jgi:two-component system response regulator HydG
VLDILLIDDEPELREVLQEALRAGGHSVQTAVDGGQGLDQIKGHVFDVVVCDVRLPKMDGLTLMRRARQESPRTEVILMTAHADVADAVAALKEGAYDYLTKPFDVDELLMQLARLDEHKSLKVALHEARTKLSGNGSSASPLVGESPGIRRALDMIRMVGPSDAPVLIAGESGTGKELAAHMLHDASSRRDKPLIAVNCGALAENLIEAELFGHERGAFTGAVKRRDGRFKAADGGTLFLDEVAELPLPAQAKLLRVLQEGTFEPVGADAPVKVDVRVISATHRDLRERIKTGAFREDLYYRINVIEIPLPPLRDRPSDLPLLIRYFLSKGTPAGIEPPRITPRAWAALSQHTFPGNVRELGHAMEHARILAGGGEIDLHHLPQSIMGSMTRDRATTGGVPAPVEPPGTVRPLTVALREFELQYLQRAVELAEGKRVRAAEWLGISRKTLWEKLRNKTTNGAASTIEVEEENTPPL